MERRLIVMRHAKSSWTSEAGTDHDRPLDPRGRRDAPEIAARLARLEWRPDYVLSSDSRRTRETYALMRDRFTEPPPVDFLRSLYHAGLPEVRAEAAAMPPDVRCALVLGHNPGWEVVVEWLSGKGVRMKTANAALLEGEGKTWGDAFSCQGEWKLREVLSPAEL